MLIIGVQATDDIHAGQEIVHIKRKTMFSAKFGAGKVSELKHIFKTLEDNPVLELVASIMYHVINIGKCIHCALPKDS